MFFSWLDVYFRGESARKPLIKVKLLKKGRTGIEEKPL